MSHHIKRFSKEDYQYYLNKDLYCMVKELIMIKQKLCPDNNLTNDFCSILYRKINDFAEKYSHFPGKLSLKLALNIYEAFGRSEKDALPQLNLIGWKNMYKAFYVLQEEFNVIYNDDAYWDELIKATVDFGETYCCAGEFAKALASGFSDAKNEERIDLKHIADLLSLQI